MMLRVTAIAFLIRAIPLCCWSAPITGHPYSHEFGKVAFKYAYGAHSKHVDCIKSWSSFFAQSMPFEQSLTDVQVLTAGGHQAFIGVTRGEVQLSAAASTPQLVVVSFSGDGPAGDVLFDHQSVPFKTADPHWTNTHKGMTVHKGFLKLYELFARRTRLNSLLAERMRTRSDCTILFTGHGLGGALATLSAATFKAIKEHRQYDTMVYTFGAPKVGNSIFARFYGELVTTSWRVTRSHGLVPLLPPCQASRVAREIPHAAGGLRTVLAVVLNGKDGQFASAFRSAFDLWDQVNRKDDGGDDGYCEFEHTAGVVHYGHDQRIRARTAVHGFVPYVLCPEQDDFEEWVADDADGNGLLSTATSVFGKVLSFATGRPEEELGRSTAYRLDIVADKVKSAVLRSGKGSAPTTIDATGTCARAGLCTDLKRLSAEQRRALVDIAARVSLTSLADLASYTELVSGGDGYYPTEVHLQDGCLVSYAMIQDLNARSDKSMTITSDVIERAGRKDLANIYWVALSDFYGAEELTSLTIEVPEDARLVVPRSAIARLPKLRTLDIGGMVDWVGLVGDGMIGANKLILRRADCSTDVINRHFSGLATLELVDLQADSIDISSMPALQHLTIRNCPQVVYYRTKAVHGGAVTSLSISSSSSFRLAPIGNNRKLLPFPNLASLTLDGISRIDFDQFSTLTRLQSLTVANVKQPFNIAEKTFQSLGDLKSLDMHGSSLTTIHENAFTECKQLHIVDFSKCKQLEAIPAGVFRNTDPKMGTFVYTDDRKTSLKHLGVTWAKPKGDALPTLAKVVVGGLLVAGGVYQYARHRDDASRPHKVPANGGAPKAIKKSWALRGVALGAVVAALKTTDFLKTFKAKWAVAHMETAGATAGVDGGSIGAGGIAGLTIGIIAGAALLAFASVKLFIWHRYRSSDTLLTTSRGTGICF